MLYFFYTKKAVPESTLTVSKKATELANSLLKKKPDASLFIVTDENWSESLVDEYTSSQGLFSNKYIILFKDIFSKKEIKEPFLDKIQELAESPNIFILSQSGIDAVSLKKIEKYAEKSQEILVKSSDNSKNTEFKMFDMADAFGERDAKRLWILFRQAVDTGKALEEIHGIIFWQVKSILIAARTKSATEAGLNPYVYSKSKRYAEVFSEKELLDMLKELISIYHDAHRGEHDFETALEIFILKKVSLQVQ